MPAKETKRPEAAFPSRRDHAAGGVVLKKLAPDAPGAKRFANRYATPWFACATAKTKRDAGA